MSAKNETEVTIGNRTYTLSGYESEEYLQKYINLDYEAPETLPHTLTARFPISGNPMYTDVRRLICRPL